MQYFLYVLTSSTEDFYCEQAIFSITSLRMHNPDAYVILLTERDTYKSLSGFRSKIKELVNKIKVVNFSHELSLTIRSRLLKTSMRNLIRGDFLYIDCDTIVCKNLEKISKFDCLMGAVLDGHDLVNNENLTVKQQLKAFKRLDFTQIQDGGKFFNSGILYVKDVKQTRIFFKLWNELYLHSVSKNVWIDQPSLNEANSRFDNFIQELPGSWNCLATSYGLNYISDAKIFHYAGGNFFIKDYSTKKNHILLNNDFWKSVKEKGMLDKISMSIIKNVKKFFSNGFWINSYTSIRYPHIVIEPEQMQEKELYIWGCGIDSYFVLAACKMNNWQVKGFLDTNVSNSYCGYAITKPETILSKRKRNFFIIISSRRYSKEMCEMCVNAGLKEGVDFWRPN